MRVCSEEGVKQKNTQTKKVEAAELKPPSLPDFRHGGGTRPPPLFLKLSKDTPRCMQQSLGYNSRQKRSNMKTDVWVNKTTTPAMGVMLVVALKMLTKQ